MPAATRRKALLGGSAWFRERERLLQIFHRRECHAEKNPRPTDGGPAGGLAFDPHSGAGYQAGCALR